MKSVKVGDKVVYTMLGARFISIVVRAVKGGAVIHYLQDNNRPTQKQVRLSELQPFKGLESEIAARKK